MWQTDGQIDRRTCQSELIQGLHIRCMLMPCEMNVLVEYTIVSDYRSHPTIHRTTGLLSRKVGGVANYFSLLSLTLSLTLTQCPTSIVVTVDSLLISRRVILISSISILHHHQQHRQMQTSTKTQRNRERDGQTYSHTAR